MKKSKAKRLTFKKALPPASPPAGFAVVFYDKKAGVMCVKKPNGDVVSLEQ